MKNPLRKCNSWWEREGERAKAKGGLQLFWYSLTSGLIWAIFMVALVTLVNYDLLGEKHYAQDSYQFRTNTYFLMGMVVGLVTWIKHAKFDKGRRP